jgi:hypothetical protein
MNTALNIRLTEQIQQLTQQDLIRLCLFIDEILRGIPQQGQLRKPEMAPPARFLAGLKPTGIPGGKIPFNRAMIYDDLAI